MHIYIYVHIYVGHVRVFLRVLDGEDKSECSIVVAYMCIYMYICSYICRSCLSVLALWCASDAGI